MNLTALALVLLLLHLLVCLLLWRMVRKGLLDAQGYFLPFMLLIPFWGTDLCTAADHAQRSDR